ncbi:hypothetical protein L1987_74467 [Smallanthus sonchifolius]|uniref:Uncharacterized protein n=1 Tax=Smallanthus sonchifolius TaxID=185202 RepID=A0ACB9A3F6_9ASTR|nr:hypothetical protein L1987_74467 [Smallanthus sonchifolius]
MNRRFWTFSTLVGAFVDLFIAYFLLCGSTVALFAVKFLGLLGSDYTSLLLVDYPTDKVSAVELSATTKFPFDSVLFGNRKGFTETEVEASCSSRKVVGNEIDEKERGFDMKLKGKGSLNYRRRRKASSVSSSSNWVTCVDQNDEAHSCCGPETTSFLSDFNYEAETPMVVKSVTRYHEDFALNDAQNKMPVNEGDKDKIIVLLTRELEESQAARAALYVELEKERNAAASAADEAMSMILRLQEEKASVKMESRQFQRMIEEKSAYDEEEMNILKEIVFRREREKHFLEKQVEAYRQMICAQNDGGNNQDFIQDPDLTFQNQEDFDFPKKKNSRLYEDFDFSKQEEPEKTIASVWEEKGLDVKPGDASVGGETGSRVYDVHVIDNEPTSSEKSNGLDMSVSSKSRLRRNSTSALDNERTRLDTEVEWLRERLRIVQEGREKLNLSVDKESLQLQLLEDIARQLQEIRTLNAPQTARQASLPLPSSKVLKKKRRYRSASSGHAKSS